MTPLKPESKMNSIEEEFSWILEQKKRDRQITDYAFEALTFRLADRTTYTPDFVIVHRDHFELVDVKARGVVKVVRSKSGKAYKKQWTSKRDDAAVKVKVAARMFPWMKWSYWYREANGTWTKECVN
jgi:hypothetical protein